MCRNKTKQNKNTVGFYISPETLLKHLIDHILNLAYFFKI